MDRSKLLRFVAWSSALLVVVAIALGHLLSSAFGQPERKPVTTQPAAASEAKGPASPWVAVAIAISVASGALGAGYAVGKVGSAAIGAASERPEIMGRALVFVVIAEGIAVWGLVGAILLVGRL